MLWQLFTLSVYFGSSIAAPSATGIAPTVNLDSATFTGVTLGRVSKFLGIPFAQPPTGDRRFRLPEPIPAYTGAHQALSFGPACPQQAFHFDLPGGLPSNIVDTIVNVAWGVIFPDNEDCLTINIFKPADATPASKLPVVAWIFGGGFQIGAPNGYDGGLIVERSIQLGEPAIYVSFNYRLNAFGFLASKEVKDANVGNMGLHDQREALRWIQKYIGAFGGDPSKVTIWGESAGAVSVALQMVANGGNSEGLFRGGFMQSGSPLPIGDITHGQKYYDALVADTGCSNAVDTLACLRTVSYDKLKAAIDKSPSIASYQSLISPWLPRADGVFLTDNPQQLVIQNKVANIPFVTGNCDDEGTLFALSSLNITTEAQFRGYIKTYWAPGISDADLDTVMKLYPADPRQGSPYGTGPLNALTPQFKRIASFEGDTAMQSTRRFFLQHRSGTVNTWAFLSKRFKWLPALGSVHGSDLLNSYGGGELEDYLINFVVKQDPNGGGRPNWPKYTTQSPQLLTFNDNPFQLTSLTQDTFRKDPIDFITKMILQYPL